MQDTNWSQIEWELLSEEIELSPPWKADHFFNTFRLDMDGIYKIQIWRDEEYMLRAKPLLLYSVRPISFRSRPIRKPANSRTASRVFLSGTYIWK